MAAERKLEHVSPRRIPLIQSPTPLHRLERLSGEVEVDLWIKRDDLTGFAMGGNKGRKLEYLLADIEDAKVDAVVTCGAIQSNFIRQLGAACAKIGVRCIAAVMDTPFETELPNELAKDQGGNVVLGDWLGIEMHRYPNGTWETLYDFAEALAVVLEDQGLNVYRMPIGGSSPLGAYAFLEAAKELDQTFDWIVFASSSGSTHTGLATAFFDSPTRILGVACDPEPEIAEDFALLSKGLAKIVPKCPLLTATDFELVFDYVGPGYGIPSQAGDDAIRRLSRTEGIFLDPIYSGKAFAALLDLIGNKVVGGKILFWHTGGIPSLFAY